MERILTGIVVIMASIAFIWMFAIGLNKSEAVRCEQLMKQAREYPQWYSTHQERVMCIHHGIALPSGAITN